jgi:XTP/dITP diphosphohydrolase
VLFRSVELAAWLAPRLAGLSSKLPDPRPQTLFVLADDSGLEVDALNGAPGVHSARFAAPEAAKSGNTPDADNNAKLLGLLRDVPAEKRTARFHCVIAIVEIHSPSSILHPRVFDGACEGCIGFKPRGKKGFGYDPLFTPVGFKQTFAQLGEDVKNRLSHRARALEMAKAFLSTKQ